MTQKMLMIIWFCRKDACSSVYAPLTSKSPNDDSSVSESLRTPPPPFIPRAANHPGSFIAATAGPSVLTHTASLLSLVLLSLYLSLSLMRCAAGSLSNCLPARSATCPSSSPFPTRGLWPILCPAFAVLKSPRLSESLGPSIAPHG